MHNDNKIYLLLTAIIILFLLHVLYLNCIAEDAYISFRYAKNLVDYHALVWNPGEPPVEGYTNFLWVIFCAFAYRIGLSLPFFAGAFGTAFSMLSILLIYKLCNKILNWSAIHSIIPCIFLALSGPFATWASSGMETSLFTFLLAAGCYYFVKFRSTNLSKNIYYCVFYLFLATLTRPEGLMTAFLIFCIGFIFSIRQKENGKLLKPALIYLTLFAIYFIWRYNYFGYPLPNTFYAKTGTSLHQFFRGGVYAAAFVFFFITPILPIMVWYYIYHRKQIKSISSLFNMIGEHSAETSLLTVCIILPLVYTAYIIVVGGDYMAMFRFFVPVLPFIYILFGKIFRDLHHRINAGNHKYLFLLTGFALIFTFIHSTPYEEAIFNKAPYQHGNYRGVEIERWHTARYEVIGKFFDGYKKNNAESLATDAIGVISYYADLVIYDTYGVVDVHIAHTKTENLGKGLPGHEKQDDLYMFSKLPTYYMYSNILSDKPVLPPDFDDNVKSIIAENYKVTNVWLKDIKNNEEGYFTFLELASKNVTL